MQLLHTINLNTNEFREQRPIIQLCRTCWTLPVVVRKNTPLFQYYRKISRKQPKLKKKEKMNERIIMKTGLLAKIEVVTDFVWCKLKYNF